MSPMLQFTTARVTAWPDSVIAGWPVLWIGDNLSDDPSPVAPPEGCEIAGHGTRYVEGEYPSTFVVLRGRAGCGHEIMRRVGFFENIKTFEHYGTVFEGSRFSIKNAAERMTDAMRRNCPLCGLVWHSMLALTLRLKDSSESQPRHLERIKALLDSNFANWRDLLSEDELEKKVKEALS